MTARRCARHRNPLVGWAAQRKLCEACRAEIRTRRAAGASLSHLARQYDVSINAVWRICQPSDAETAVLAERVAAVRRLAAVRALQDDKP